MQCRLCGDKNEDESEKHLLNCQTIKQEQAKLTVDHNCASSELLNAKYEDIFSDNIEKQISITKKYDLIFKTRDSILNATAVSNGT